jgi:hypothetical protein
VSSCISKESSGLTAAVSGGLVTDASCRWGTMRGSAVTVRPGRKRSSKALAGVLARRKSDHVLTGADARGCPPPKNSEPSNSGTARRLADRSHARRARSAAPRRTESAVQPNQRCASVTKRVNADIVASPQHEG